MIVLDTSVLLYWTLDPILLSSKAQHSIEGTDRILLSSITIWELALKVKRGKLILPISIPEYVKRLEQVEALEILPVDVQTWLDNIELPWEHRDPADRTIVAIASHNNCPLVSSDHIIADFYPQTIW